MRCWPSSTVRPQKTCLACSVHLPRNHTEHESPRALSRCRASHAAYNIGALVSSAPSLEDQVMRGNGQGPSRGLVVLVVLICVAIISGGCETIERRMKGNPNTAVGAGVGGA